MPQQSRISFGLKDRLALAQSWALVAISGLGLALLAGALAFGLKRESDDLTGGAFRETQNLAIALEQHVARTIDSADSRLRAVVQQVRQNGISDPGLRDFMLDLIRQTPQAEAMAVLDSEGRLIRTTISALPPSVSYADREFVQKLRQNPAIGLVIPHPVQGRLRPRWVIPIARSIMSPEGRFVGIVSIGIESAYFDRFLEGIDVGPRGSITIYLSDATVLARAPDGANFIGKQYPREGAFGGSSTSHAMGSYSAISALDGIERFYAYRALSEFPLVVTVGVALKDVFAPWWRDLVTAVLLWMAAALFVGGLLGLILGAHRRGTRTDLVYHHILSSLSEMVIVIDHHGIVQSVNPAVEVELGYAPEEVVGRNVKMLMGEPHRSAHDGFLRHLIESGEARFLGIGSRELTAMRKDGGVIAIELTLTEAAVHGRRYYVGVMRNITSRRKREEELAEIRRRLSDALRRARLSYWRQEWTPRTASSPYTLSLKFEWAEVTEALLGLPAKDLPTSDQEYLKLVHPEDRERVTAVYLRAGTTSQAYELDYRIIRPDGEIAWMHEFADVEWQDEGKQGAYVGILQDITAQRHREEALEQAGRLTQIGHYRWSVTASRLTSMSKGYRRILGLPEDEAPTDLMGLRPYLHPEDSARAVQEWEAAVRERRGVRVDFRIRRPDGAVRHIRDLSEPELGAGEGAETYFGTIQDVTDLKLMEEQLAHAHRLRAIGQLTGGIAHDFNNLLAVVIGNLEMLEGEIEAKSPARPFARVALEASVRGANLIHNMLAFARQQPLQSRKFDLNALVTTTVAFLSHTLGEQVETRLILAADLRRPFADPSQVESALTNLAINARDAMPRGGRMTVETMNVSFDEAYAAENPDVSAGDYVALIVSDTGIGMSEEVLRHIFEPFFTTKEVGKGTGLGLAMVYGFALQSGGHVKVASEVGQGSTVRLYLPATKEMAPAKVDEISPV